MATNTETNEQAGPSDAYCLAYNRVRQLLAGGTDPVHDCSYVASGYFGTCVCPDTKYKCTEASDGSWFCERLDKTIQNPQRRYIMSASIKDHTGSTLATFFDDQA